MNEDEFKEEKPIFARQDEIRDKIHEKRPNLIRQNGIKKTIMETDINSKLLEKLRKTSNKLGQLTKKYRPNFKRQNGIKRKIQDMGDGDGVTKSLLMEWWDMLALQKKIINHLENNPNDLITQNKYRAEKMNLIRNKNQSLKNVYTKSEKDRLINWANSHIRKEKHDIFIKTIGKYD